MKRNFGISFVDVIVVVAIISLFASVAIPAYTLQLEKTRRAEGQAKLMEVMHEQEKYHRVNKTYVTDLSMMGYDQPTEKTTNEFYTISALPCGKGINDCVKLTASADIAQADDGSLTLDSIGRKERVMSDGDVKDW